jgi:hypothetical protein
VIPAAVATSTGSFDRTFEFQDAQGAQDLGNGKLAALDDLIDIGWQNIDRLQYLLLDFVEDQFFGLLHDLSATEFGAAAEWSYLLEDVFGILH